MIDTRVAFIGLVSAVALMRLIELRLARRNTRRALAAGAVEIDARAYPAMVAMHTAFLVASPLEVLVFARPYVAVVAIPAVLALLAAASLRLWVLHTLGERWTTRIICFPGRRVVRRGPYRYMRHPNYVAVAVEIAALPLVHSAYLSAALFSLINALVLYRRIQVEEGALAEHSGYREVFG